MKITEKLILCVGMLYKKNARLMLHYLDLYEVYQINYCIRTAKKGEDLKEVLVIVWSNCC
jgi:hypothetical protein